MDLGSYMTPLTSLFKVNKGAKPADYATPKEMEMGIVVKSSLSRGASELTMHGGGASFSRSPSSLEGYDGTATVWTAPLHSRVSRTPSGASVPNPLAHGRSNSLAPLPATSTPGVQYDVPVTRVFVGFDFGRFLLCLVYNVFHPLSLPLVLAIEGPTAARNMSFLKNPFTPSAAVSWCVAHGGQRRPSLVPSRFVPFFRLWR